MLDLAAAAQLDLELDLQIDCEFGLQQDPTRMLLVSIGNMSASSRYATAVSGGEAGDAAGFGIAQLLIIDKLGTARWLGSRGNSGPNVGYGFFLSAANALSFMAASGASAAISSPTYTLNPSDVGRVLLLLGWHDGSRVRLMVSRQQPGDGTAIVGYTPYAQPYALSGTGPDPTSAPALDVRYLASASWRGVPSIAQLQAYCDQARQQGDLPAAFPTFEGRLPTTSLLAEFGPDSVTLDGSSNVVRIQNKRGADGFAVAAGTLAAPAADPLAKNQLAIAFTGTQRAEWDLALSAQRFMHDGSGMEVWNVVAMTSATNTTWGVMGTSNTSSTVGLGISAYPNVIVANGAARVIDAAPAGNLVSVNVPHALGFYHKEGDSTEYALERNNAITSAGTTALVPSAATDPSHTLYLGAFQNSVFGQFKWYGSWIFNGKLSAEEREQLRMYFLSKYGVGATTITHRWSARDELRGSSAVANNQSAPAQLTDTITRASADALLRAGFGVQRSSGGAFLGVGPYVQTTTYLKTAVNGGIQGGPTMHVVADVWLTKVPTALEHWVSCEGTGGWYLVASATGVLGIGLGSVGEVPIYQLTAADLNKTLRIVLNNVNKNAELWINGVYAGNWNAGTFIATANASMFVGQRFTDTRAFTSGYVKLVQGGSTTSLTAGEIAAANADLTQPPPVIPGKTQKQYIFETDVAGANGLLPAKFTELMAGAAVDDLTVIGAGVRVRIIDPTIDGRRLLGAQGLSATNGLQTAVSAGIAGVGTGFHVAMPFTAYVGSAANRFIGGRLTASSGWSLDINAAGTALRAVVYNSTPAAVVITATLLAADLGRPRLAVLNHTGTTIELYVDGVLLAFAACAGFTPAAASTVLGILGTTSEGVSTHGMSGGHTAAKLSDIASAQASWEATGRVPALPGAQHLWDLTTDILASGVDAVPAQVLDRVGTDHMTRVGIDVRSTANSIRAVGPYGATDGWTTAAGGGVRGAASGMHILADVWLTAIPTVRQMITATSDVATAAKNWYLDFGPALRFVIGGVNASASYTITGADLNKRLRIIGVKTATHVQLWVNGVQVGADVAAAGFNVDAALTMTVGTLQGTAYPLLSGYVETVVGGNTIATPANVATYCADLTQAPPTIPGVTLKRYAFEQDIAEAGGALPSKSVERVSGGDSLGRAGSPLVLAQRRTRLFSYETSPIMQAAGGFNASSRFETPTGTGIIGNASGVWIGVLFRVLTTATGRILSHSNGGALGWNFNITGGTLFQFTIVDGGGVNRTAPSGTVAADSKLRLAIGRYDGQAVSLLVNRAQAGSSTAATGYSPTFLSLVGNCIGALSGGTSPNAGVEVLGVMGGDGQVPSLAEYLAADDAAMAFEDIVAIPGRTEHLWSVKKRVNGVIVDQIGSAHYSPIGAPVITDIYHRAFAA